MSFLTFLSNGRFIRIFETFFEISSRKVINKVGLCGNKWQKVVIFVLNLQSNS